jgi:hypothetical protein
MGWIQLVEKAWLMHCWMSTGAKASLRFPEQ